MKKKDDAPASLDMLDVPVRKMRDVLAELACTNTALRRAARRIGQLYDEALAPLGLKATQLALLAETYRQRDKDGQEGPTLHVLAEQLGIQISALTHALRPLVREGLVEIRPDAEDGRTKRGVLTSAGETRLEEALALWASANGQVDAVLGPDTTRQLRDLADEVASEEFLHAYVTGGSLRSDGVKRARKTDKGG
jgi:DNA-binding MarR family transcriptional regulator